MVSCVETFQTHIYNRGSVSRKQLLQMRSGLLFALMRTTKNMNDVLTVLTTSILTSEVYTIQ